MDCRHFSLKKHFQVALSSKLGLLQTLFFVFFVEESLFFSSLNIDYRKI